jgi:hypothetical protein
MTPSTPLRFPLGAAVGKVLHSMPSSTLVQYFGSRLLMKLSNPLDVIPGTTQVISLGAVPFVGFGPQKSGQDGTSRLESSIAADPDVSC